MGGIMMKRLAQFVALLLCIQLFVPFAAQGDAYELHTPSGEQIQQEEAVALACAFVKDLTGVELMGLYAVEDGMKVEGQPEMYFGPGWQWDADTQEDCWAIHLCNETHIQPFVVLHGITGEVLYWEYDNQENGCSYINRVPEEGQLSYEDVRMLAVDRFMNATADIENMPQQTFLGAGFGPADNWYASLQGGDCIPAWHINIQTPLEEAGYHYSLLVTAEDEVILRETLYFRNEDGLFMEMMNDVNDSYVKGLGQP